MTRDDLDLLIAAVWRDESLQDDLRAVPDEAAFIARTVVLAAARGLQVEPAEVLARMRANFTVLMLLGAFA